MSPVSTASESAERSVNSFHFDSSASDSGDFGRASNGSDIEQPQADNLEESSNSDLSSELASEGNRSTFCTMNSQFSESSDDTIEYDPNMDFPPRHDNSNEIIEINDTQILNVTNIGDDDDVILVPPQQIEVIDLCTQLPQVNEEVIVINDSQSRQRRRRAENSNSIQVLPDHSHRLRSRNRTTPYSSAGASSALLTVHNVTPNSSSHNQNQPGPSHRRNATARALPGASTDSVTLSHSSTAKLPNIDEFKDDVGSSSLNITCPVCLDSIVSRQPVSTNCGHLFCKTCIQESLRVLKKCPMCKKTLSGRNPFHNIWL